MMSDYFMLLAAALVALSVLASLFGAWSITLILAIAALYAALPGLIIAIRETN